jgi:hypothetical protein
LLEPARVVLSCTHYVASDGTASTTPGWLKVTVVQLPRALGMDFAWVARGTLLRLAPASDLALFFEDDHQLRYVCA